MKSKLKKPLISLAVLLFWLAVWEILAIIIDLEFVLPRVEVTILTLFSMLCKKDFYLIVLSSLVRIFSSFFIGVLIAIALALLAIRLPFFKALVTPLITISKTTPVAVLITLLWLILTSGTKVTGVVAILMVVPVIWQNMLDGYGAIDKQLDEVTKIYGFSYLKRLKILVLPTLLKFLFPGIITASGLAWKAGIAAEVICITKNSIGKEIYNAKFIHDGPKTFAFTIVAILLSIAVEKLIRLLVKGVSKKCRL